MVHFIQVLEIVGTELPIIFPYCLFNACEVCSNIISFIPELTVLYLFFIGYLKIFLI